MTAQRTPSRGPAIVGLLFVAGVLGFLVFSGQVYAITQGSSIGLVLSIGLLIVACVLSAMATVIAGRQLFHRERPAPARLPREKRATPRDTGRKAA